MDAQRHAAPRICASVGRLASVGTAPVRHDRQQPSRRALAWL